jgi:hypothetical protein
MRPRWFGPKMGTGRGLSGFGATPVTWQGWAVVGVMILVLTGLSFWPGLTPDHVRMGSIAAILVTIGVIGLTYGPEPR